MLSNVIFQCIKLFHHKVIISLLPTQAIIDHSICKCRKIYDNIPSTLDFLHTYIQTRSWYWMIKIHSQIRSHKLKDFLVWFRVNISLKSANYLTIYRWHKCLNLDAFHARFNLANAYSISGGNITWTTPRDAINQVDRYRDSIFPPQS